MNRLPVDRLLRVAPHNTVRAARARAAVACLTLLVGGSLPAGAQPIYESLDADGHRVYTDRAPDRAAEPIAVAPEAPAPPPVIHFCWTNCFTLTLDQGGYRRADGADEHWTIQRLTSSSITLHRHDAPQEWNGYSTDVVYEGRIRDGRLNGMTVSGQPVAAIQAAFGAALDTVPGSNAERDQRHWVAPVEDAATAGALPGTTQTAPTLPIVTTDEPPPLRQDAQPPLPAEGYLWTPGYWRWGPGRYVWVSGLWVRPPGAGLLWTPGYWIRQSGGYAFQPGHWGPLVGFYGGVNYGHGYGGSGYSGGHWLGTAFAYNSAVSNLSAVPVAHAYAAPAGVASATPRASVYLAPGSPLPVTARATAGTGVVTSRSSPSPATAGAATVAATRPAPPTVTRTAAAPAPPKSETPPRAVTSPARPTTP